MTRKACSVLSTKMSDYQIVVMSYGRNPKERELTYFGGLPDTGRGEKGVVVILLRKNIFNKYNNFLWK